MSLKIKRLSAKDSILLRGALIATANCVIANLETQLWVATKESIVLRGKHSIGDDWRLRRRPDNASIPMILTDHNPDDDPILVTCFVRPLLGCSLVNSIRLEALQAFPALDTRGFS